MFSKPVHYALRGKRTTQLRAFNPDITFSERVSRKGRRRDRFLIRTGRSGWAEQWQANFRIVGVPQVVNDYERYFDTLEPAYLVHGSKVFWHT